MKHLGKVMAVGAACGACLVVPAVIAAISGAGAVSLAALGSGYVDGETLICVGLPLLLVAGGYAWMRRRRQAVAASQCSTDGSCGCAPSGERAGA